MPARPNRLLRRSLLPADRHMPIPPALRDPEGARSIVEDAVARFGRIDAVINNAGFLRDAIFHK